MELVSEKPSMIEEACKTRVNPADVVVVAVICVLMGVVYVPLLHWLGAMTLHTQQLLNGALLVVFAVIICVRDAVGRLRISIQVGNEGIALIALAFACLWLAARWKEFLLPLMLVSACLTFAALVSFLFGKAGVRQFLPALGAF